VHLRKVTHAALHPTFHTLIQFAGLSMKMALKANAQQFDVLCVGCADRPAGAFVEHVYSRGGKADEENAAKSGHSGQGKANQRKYTCV